MKLRLGDFYRDISNDVEARFNARDFDTDHSSGTSIPIPTAVRTKKVIGMMKQVRLLLTLLV